MTKIKLCGLTRPCEIQAVNDLRPDYVGFVFYPKSRRCLTPKQAVKLRQLLDPDINAVGVFVDEPPEKIAVLLGGGVIDIAQLHGQEDTEYVMRLRELSDKPIIKAFCIGKPEDCLPAEDFPSEYLLLDSGMGSGVGMLHPYGVDVSSGIETDGIKDLNKMAAFVAAVREEDAK